MQKKLRSNQGTPTYNYFLYLLIHDWKFKWGVSVMFILLVSFGVLFPKVWDVSPDTVTKKVRISILDLIQSYSFKKQSIKHEKNGEILDAFSTWSLCIANRPFQSNSLKSFLLNAQKLREPTRIQVGKVTAAVQMVWEMPFQNGQDQILAIQTLLKLGGIQQASFLLERDQSEPHPDIHALRVMTKMFNGMPLGKELIDELRGNSADGHKMSGFLLTALVRTHGIRTPQNLLPPFWEMVEQNYADSELPTYLADSLCFLVAARGKDVDVAQKYYSRLKEKKLLRAWHQMRYCKRLKNTGQKDILYQEMATIDSIQTFTDSEIIEFANLFLDLNLPNRSREAIESGLTIYPKSPKLWLRLGNLLISEREWTDIRSMAVKLRLEPSFSDFKSYSYFIEWYSYLKQNRKTEAQNSLDKWMQQEIGIPEFERQFISQLADEGNVNFAIKRYRELEEHFEKDIEFWEELRDFASEHGQYNYLLRASRQLYELEPDSIVFSNNYAAIQLALRADASHAISLTFPLVNRFTNNIAIRLNHTHALLQNRRIKEAEEILFEIDRASLNPDYVPFYDAAEFELLFLQSKNEDAISLAESMDIEKLYLPQQIWIKEIVTSISDSLMQP